MQTPNPALHRTRPAWMVLGVCRSPMRAGPVSWVVRHNANEDDSQKYTGGHYRSRIGRDRQYDPDRDKSAHYSTPRGRRRD